MKILISTIFLTFWFSASSKAFVDFRDNKPSAKKQHFCQETIKKFSHLQVKIYPKFYHNPYNESDEAIMRPISSAWELSHIKKPWWFNDKLFYVYRQKTADGYSHQAHCEWKEDGWVTVFVDRPFVGESAVCDTYGWRDDFETQCSR